MSQSISVKITSAHNVANFYIQPCNNDLSNLLTVKAALEEIERLMGFPSPINDCEAMIRPSFWVGEYIADIAAN